MFKSRIVLPAAKFIRKRTDKQSRNALQDQELIFQKLLSKGTQTQFGIDHDFKKISSYEQFKSVVPLRSYEAYEGYINNILQGGSNILWPGKPAYLAKTSGTTSGAKYIPITRASLPSHVGTARTAFFNFFARNPSCSVLDGKMIFLSGSPVLNTTAGIPTGRLSGIVNHEIPGWLKPNKLPGFKTNSIEDWEEKLDKIIEETAHRDLRMISGIPPWVKMYYEKLLEYTGKSTVLEVFPNFQLFVYGGVNFEPYRNSLEKLVGGKVNSIETYPASEGFIAFQNDTDDNAMLLNTNAGIFYEFVKREEVFDENPERISLKDVQINVDYAIILNTNAGLWGYILGDTVKFTQLDPYKIIVSGRVAHYTSAFGEHVISQEVESSVSEITNHFGISISEFTVAPQVNPIKEELPYHEWFIEFNEEPTDLQAFSLALDREMCKRNIYYEDLIKGNILQPLVVRSVQKDGFKALMKGMGKLGGQNKVPHLSNDRRFADFLGEYSK